MSLHVKSLKHLQLTSGLAFFFSHEARFWISCNRTLRKRKANIFETAVFMTQPYLTCSDTLHVALEYKPRVKKIIRQLVFFQNEPFSTAERSERVENFLFRATREYTEAGIEQATVAMRRLGANSPEPRKRAVREWHVSTQKTGSYITERSRLPGLIVGPSPREESLCCPARVVFVSFVRCMSVGIECTLPRRQR